MKSILLLRKMKLKEDLRLVGIMTVITLIMIGVFSSFDYTPQKINFGIVDEDQSSLSSHITEDLKALGDYNFKVLTLDQAKDQVKSEDIAGAFYMTPGFMDQVLDGRVEVDRLLIQENMDTMQMQAIFQGVMKRAVDDDRLMANIYALLEDQDRLSPETQETVVNKIHDEWAKGAPVTVTSRSIKAEDTYSPIKQSVIGFSLFFAMFTIIFGVSDILMEKENFTWHRQMIAPLSKLGILSGHMTFVFLLGFSQVSAMFLVSKYVFKVEWTGYMGHLLLVIAAFVFCVASLGMFLSNFVKSMGQLSAVSPIIITGSAMIGGCFWPLEIVTSKILLFMSLLTPQRWAIQGIYAIIVYDQGLQSILIPLLILCLMGLSYLLTGAWLLNRKAV